MPLQGDAGVYECHANNKWSMDMRSFRFGAENAFQVRPASLTDECLFRTDYVIEFEKK